MKRAVAFALACAALSAAPAAAQKPPLAAAPDDAAVAAERIKPFQYLYGSAEAGALSIGTWHALTEFARSRVARRPADSVVLAEGSTLADPHFVPCADKPLAAVFDVDETVLLNLGLEEKAAAGESMAGGMIGRWGSAGAQGVAPVPGAVYALGELRKLGVTVIFNTNRAKSSADGTAAALAAAGLGPAVHGETLFLSGDDGMGARKDGRRWTIAAKYCVIAMAGDQLVDFSDLFNDPALSVVQRREAAIRGWPAQMWSNGWFVLPNPVYGSALRGTIDDIFPADKRWDDTRKGN